MSVIETGPKSTLDSPGVMNDYGTLYASFDSVSHADKAAGALLDLGVRAEDISLIAQDSHHVDGVHESAADASLQRDDMSPIHVVNAEHMGAPLNEIGDVEAVDHDNDLNAKVGISTTTPADAAAGASKGAGIGLGVGIAAALAAIFVPGFGLVAGGGALAMAIGGAAGATAAGAMAGGVTGYLKDQGIPEEAIDRYIEYYDTGGAILAVSVPSNGIDFVAVQNMIWKYGGSNVSSYRSKHM